MNDPRNTHRALVETSVPPGMQFIAAGAQDWCEARLKFWLEKHPLGEYEVGLVVQVVTSQVP